jgi:hypothetical protein
MFCSVVSCLIFSATSCGNRDSEAVRYIVLAELIQREGVTDNQIRVGSVRFPSDDAATVEATILQSATKAATPERKVQCRLERKEGRWSLVSVDDGS